ncbi:uncharacterized protein LOC135680793 [Rhopilema esculentum]|uniref:uncharacterized protein LOC135680793 n=1 Tax=Rhopilema esculentum TaxID=499914 RepID=UPI0031D06B4F
MTICKTLDNAFECFEGNSLTRVHKRVQRQDNLEIMDEEVDFEESRFASPESHVEMTNNQDKLPHCSARVEDTKKDGALLPRPKPLTARWSFPARRCVDILKEENIGIRKRLSVEDITNRNENRSSLIFDWLTDPENKVMFQGRNIDSRIFRSHSAVQNRPVCNIIKSNRSHSLRQEAKEDKTCLGNSSVFREDSCTSECTMCQRTREVDKEIQPRFVEGPALTTENRITNLQVSSPKRDLDVNDLKNSSSTEEARSPVDDVKMDISTEFGKLNLSYENSCNEHKPISVCKSLPGYSGLSKKRMLQRMNSDAFFYKDMVRDCDGLSYERKTRSCSSRKRRNRLSLRLRDLVDSSSHYTGSTKTQDSGLIVDVNSKEFINNIEKIFSLCDLQQIQELAECGFDFNVRDSAGNCALHYAALRGSEKIITKILENGGNVWARNNRNQLPVELASNINVRMLLSGVTLFYRGQYSKEIENRLTSKAMSFEL